MSIEDLEQIADQNDFHGTRTGAVGAKRGSSVLITRGIKWRLRHLFALSRIMKKSKRRMANIPNNIKETM